MKAVSSFLFLGCSSPWVMELARRLGVTHHVVAVGNRPYGQQTTGPMIMEQRQNMFNYKWMEWVYPPGYAGRFEKIFSPVIAYRVLSLTKEIEKVTGCKPSIVIPYPYILPWLSRVQELKWIYYNYDDYRLYETDKAAKVVLQELELLNRCSMTTCASRTQMLRLQKSMKHPERIHHLPHGVMEHYIQRDPECPVESHSVVYIGNMEDRVNWDFVTDVARLCPMLNFYFIGRITAEASPPREWEIKRAKAFALPNVKSVGPVPQKNIHLWSWKAAVNWMPYETEHPFNIACCPTKIMDYMATGRPILSTSVPECLLYPEYITIKDHADAAAEWLQDVAGASVAPNFILYNIQFAKQNTWCKRAQEFTDLLHDM